MANYTVPAARVMMRGRTTAAWSTSEEVLLKNEIGIAEDTGLIKIGDGTTAWDDLPYINQRPAHVSTDTPISTDSDYAIGDTWVNSSAGYVYVLTDVNDGVANWKRLAMANELASLGYGDMLKTTFATNDKSAQGYVDKAIVADGLSATRTIEISGDAEGSASTTLSGDVEIAVALSDTGVTAGTYPKVTVDVSGRVTAGAALTAGDIPDLTLAKITDAGSAAALDIGTSAGDVVSVGVDGKIASSLIPEIPENVKALPVDTVAELVELTDADFGDIAIVVGENADKGKRFRLLGEDPTEAGDWIELGAPAGTVLSVNGEEGPIVELTTGAIPEGSNLYYTDTRATANFDTNFALNSSAGLTDGATILHSDDVIILDCSPV